MLFMITTKFAKVLTLHMQVQLKTNKNNMRVKCIYHLH